MNEILDKDYFNDLKGYVNSYSTRNLHYMSQFAEEFFETEIMHQPGAQILWRTLVKILHKSNFKYEELFSQPGGKIHESFSKSI